MEFQDDQSYNKNDLKLFATQNALKETDVAHIVGPYSPASPDAESTLDVEYGVYFFISSLVFTLALLSFLFIFSPLLGLSIVFRGRLHSTQQYGSGPYKTGCTNSPPTSSTPKTLLLWYCPLLSSHHSLLISIPFR